MKALRNVYLSVKNDPYRHANSLYFYLIVLLFLTTATAKMYGVFAETFAFKPYDLVFGLPQRWFYGITAALELGIAFYLIMGTNIWIKHMILAWFACNCLVYRMASWWVSPGAPCPCSGGIIFSVPAKLVQPDTLLKWAIICILSVSGLYCVKRAALRCGATVPTSLRRWLRSATIVSLTMLCLPPTQVLSTAIVNPHSTISSFAFRVMRRHDSVRRMEKFAWQDMNNVNLAFLKAVIAGEDHRFFQHRGFDWEAIRMAIIESRALGRPPVGASTISQQCARSLFLWQGRSWIRKGLEAYYTVWMELLLSKRRILELYVNVIELGDGIYGVEAAAQHYYGKSAWDLTREEAAMLAAILPAPKRWNPRQPNELVERRQQIILSLMDQIRLPWEPPEETARSRAPSDAWVQVQSESEPRHERVLATNTPSPASP